MFLDRWIPENYLVKQEVCAIECVYSENGMVFYYTWLKTKKKKLSIFSCGVAESFDHLPASIVKSKVPLILVVNGKGILFKKTALLSEQINVHELIKENLPAINIQDMHCQLYVQENGTGFLSFCRRSLVDEVLSDFTKRKFVLVEVLIGAPAAMGLRPLWSRFNTIPCSTHIIELENNDILNFKLKSTENQLLQIEELQIPQENVLGLSAGLKYLLRPNFVTNASHDLDLIHTKYYENVKLKLYVGLCVSIAFIVSITNVFFYTTYFDRKSKIEAELSVYQGKYDQINKLLSDYQGKKELIEGSGLLGKSKLSEYADRIGQTIPEEVVLASMVFNPEKNDETGTDSLKSFDKNRIIIKGNCDKSLVVNEWLNVLKMQTFVSEVNLEKFNYTKEGSAPNFELKLVTK